MCQLIRRNSSKHELYSEKKQKPRLKHGTESLLAVRPFIKWVGGKTQLIDEITTLIPSEIGSYYEPFLGGGSVLIHMLGLMYSNKCHIYGNIVASDINKELINLYIDVRDNVNELIAEINSLADHYLSLESMEDKKEFYYHIRDKFNEDKRETTHEMGDVSVSAMFVFLNKTCFRGMYRTSKKNGTFNVSFGNYKKPTFVCDSSLKLISQMFQPVEFKVSDFETLLTCTNFDKKDLIYLDPPYVKLNNESFVSYSQEGFPERKHDAMFKLVKSSLMPRIIFSNSYTHEVVSQFQEGFYIKVVEAKRRINSKHPGQTSDEVLVVNYMP